MADRRGSKPILDPRVNQRVKNGYLSRKKTRVILRYRYIAHISRKGKARGEPLNA